MSQGRTPMRASSTIRRRTQSGKGRPFTNTPPNWLTPAWPVQIRLNILPQIQISIASVKGTCNRFWEIGYHLKSPMLKKVWRGTDHWEGTNVMDRPEQDGNWHRLCRGQELQSEATPGRSYGYSWPQEWTHSEQIKPFLTQGKFGMGCLKILTSTTVGFQVVIIFWM